MRYKGAKIAVVAFATGYILRSAFAPSTPSELLSVLEEKVAKNPVKYERVIDQTREFAHQMKAKANPKDTKQGYVPFGDLRLDLESEEDGNLTFLINNYTNEKQPVKYVNNDYVGTSMDNGKIIIEGNVTKMVGVNMSGGEIHVNGSYPSIGSHNAGKVYHEGELIHPK